MPVRRLSHPEVTHFTQTGAVDEKAGKLVCPDVFPKKDSLLLAVATCGNGWMCGGELTSVTANVKVT